MKHLILISCLAFALAAGGCSTLKKVTGQTNDTILPGQREEVIPPDQMTAKDPIVAGQGQAQQSADSMAPDATISATPIVPCNPKKSACPPAPKIIQ